MRIRLSTAVERSTKGTPLFDVTVEWEYTTIPYGASRRFTCVSDRQEYNELLLDVPATSPWLMTPRPGIDAAEKSAYELLQLTVDGRPQKIWRSTRKSGQTYTVTLDREAISGKPVRIKQTTRATTPTWGHRLYVELPQPARNFSLHLDYTDTDIAHLDATHMVPSNRPPQITRSPDKDPGRSLSIEMPGWSLPKAGFAFTWTLDTELPYAEDRRKAVG